MVSTLVYYQYSVCQTKILICWQAQWGVATFFTDSVIFQKKKNCFFVDDKIPILHEIKRKMVISKHFSV